MGAAELRTFLREEFGIMNDMILTHGERRENEERFIQMLPQEEEMLYGI